LRKATVPFYALIFLTEVVWMAIVPLTPTFAERLSLTKVELGTVLAAAGLATLVVSLPIGVLADRLGTRTLTVGSSALVAVSSLGQGLATNFWTLLFSRAAFGVALGTIWTAGLAWKSEHAPRRKGTSSLGMSVTVAGVGIMLGPAFAGVTANAFGVRAPFFALATASAIVTIALLRGGGADPPYRHEPLLKTLQAAGRNRIVVGSAVLMVLLGVTGGGVNLLVPIELRSNGLSPAATGLAFSASSVIFVFISALVTLAGPRAVALRVVGIAALCYAGTMIFVVAGKSTAAIVTFLLVRSPFWAVLSTLSYPLGALGAYRADLGRGTVMGLLNLAWGAAGAVAPVAAAVIAQAASEQWAFLALMICAAATGLWLLVTRQPVSDPAADVTPEPASLPG
jgi:MFS family permease